MAQQLLGHCYVSPGNISSYRLDMALGSYGAFCHPCLVHRDVGCLFADTLRFPLTASLQQPTMERAVECLSAGFPRPGEDLIAMYLRDTPRRRRTANN